MPIINQFNPQTAVDITNNTIDLPLHSLNTTEGIIYSAGTGTSIGGLTDGQKYYVIYVNANQIKLAETEDQARTNNPVDLTSTGTGTEHKITYTRSYTGSAAYYDFFRKVRLTGDQLPEEGIIIEADNTRDTLNIIAGNNLYFENINTDTKTFTISGPLGFSLESPLLPSTNPPSATIRLRDLSNNNLYGDIDLVAFRGIRIERKSSNEIEFESFGVTETDTLQTVTSRNNITSNNLIMNNITVGEITSNVDDDGFSSTSVTTVSSASVPVLDTLIGTGILTDPVTFSPDETQSSDENRTVTVNFTTPGTGTLSYVADYRSDLPLLTSGNITLQRFNTGTSTWDTLDFVSGTQPRTNYEIQNNYSELNSSTTDFRVIIAWVGNEGLVNYRIRLYFESAPIVGISLLDTDSQNKVINIGANDGLINLRGDISVFEKISTTGLIFEANKITGSNLDQNIEIDTNGSGIVDIKTGLNVDGNITSTLTSVDVLNTTVTTVNAFGAGTDIEIGSTTGTVTINNPTVVGSQTTQNLYDTVATTVNAFGAATSLNIGADSGTLTIGNPTVVGTQTTQNLYNTVSTTVNFAGAATVISIGSASGTTSVNNDLEVKGGDITTDQTSFNLLNATATTVNAFGAATSINIGALTGTTTVNNNLTITGDLTVNGTTTTINTATLDVEDLNITVAKGSLTAAAANGAGLTVDGSAATLLYASANDSWNFNKLLTASSLENTPIGTTTRAAGNFTTLDANSTVTLSPTGIVTINPSSLGTINNMSIGATTPSTGKFTTLEVRDTTTTNFDLFFASNSSVALTADRTLTIDVENASRTISLGGNIDIANNFSTSGNFALTLTTSGITNVTLPTSGTLATTGNLSQFASTTSSQLAGVISDETGSGALVFGTSPVIATPDINAGTVDSLTSLSVRDTSAAFDVTIRATSNPVLNAARTLTFNVENASRTISLGGDIDTANNFSTSGNFALTLTTTNITNVTLPTSGTLATTGNLSQFASTTSSQLAGVISDETGSGSLVFGTNPTLAGPALGTGSTTADTDVTVDAAATTFYAYIQGATTTRTINISNLTNGRYVKLYLRNTNITTAKTVNITASTTTTGFSGVNLATSNGAASSTSVTLAANGGTACITVFNANGTIGGGM